jgi:hypothetical protein
LRKEENNIGRAGGSLGERGMEARVLAHGGLIVGFLLSMMVF